MAKISEDLTRQINGYVDKYMGMLQIDGVRPVIKLRENPDAAWAGRAALHGRLPTTTIELQQKWLSKNARFAERVIAHEMVHHQNYLENSEDERHGTAFKDGAARINAIMGPGFVTEKIRPPATKLMLALGLGGLALLTAAVLRPPPPVAQPARNNERGTYG